MSGRRICAWCGRDLGPAPDIDGETSGICDACYEAEMLKIGKADVGTGEDNESRASQTVGEAEGS